MLDPEQPRTSRAALEELNLIQNGEFTSFGHYMQAKALKLHHQVHDGAIRKSTIFNGVSIYVNGYTEPTALNLRKMIVENGGSYHHYYAYGKTTHIIAMNLSENKRWNSLRKGEKVVKPEWIVKCIEAVQLIPDDKFLVTTSSAKIQANNTKSVKPNPILKNKKSKESSKDAKTPETVENELDEMPKLIAVDPLFRDSNFSLEALGISCNTNPTKEIVRRLLRNFGAMIENAEFPLLKSTYSCLRRALYDKGQLYKYSEEWLAVIASLKKFINEESAKKYGATILS